MRRAGADVSMDCHSSFVIKTSQLVAKPTRHDQAWLELANQVERAFLRAAQAGKGSKKLSQHYLELLPSYLVLIRALPQDSDLHSSALLVTSTCLYSAESLRRQLAQQTYTGPSSEKSVDQLDSELFDSLREVAPQQDALSALPVLLSMFVRSLKDNSSQLFPLPSKGSHKSPSAAQSAAELHELQHVRSHAARWLRSAVELVKSFETTLPPVVCLQRMVDILEKQDLVHPMQKADWAPVVDEIILICRRSLIQSEHASIGNTLKIVAALVRLSYDSVTSVLKDALLAVSRLDIDDAALAYDLIDALVIHHSRSMTFGPFLRLFVEAMDAAPSRRNALVEKGVVGKIGNLVASMPEQSFESVLHDPLANVSSEAPRDEEPKKKKRRTSGDAVASRSSTLRLVALMLKFAQRLSPAAIDRIEAFLDEAIVGPDSLRIRAELVERLARVDATPRRRDDTRKLIKNLKRDDVETAVLSARLLLLQLESGIDEDISKIWSGVFERIGEAADPDSEWVGYLEEAPLNSLPASLWALLTLRFVTLLESTGGDQHLHSFAAVLVSSLDHATSSSMKSLSEQLMGRADFFELPRLKGHIQTELARRFQNGSQAVINLAKELVGPSTYYSSKLNRDIVAALLSDSSESGVFVLERLDQNMLEEISLEQATSLLESARKDAVAVWTIAFSARLRRFQREKRTDTVTEWIKALGDPFHSLAKGAKKGHLSLSEKDLAFCAALNSISDSTSSKSPLALELSEHVRSAARNLNKVLKAIKSNDRTTSRNHGPILNALVAVLRAARAFDIQLEKEGSLWSFGQACAADALQNRNEQFASACLDLLDLRAADAENLVAFEAVIAYQLQAVQSEKGVDQANRLLAHRTSRISPEAYARALQLCVDAIRPDVSSVNSDREQNALRILNVLLRTAPAGTAKASLQAITLSLAYISRTPTLLGASAHRFLTRSRFVEQVVQDKPLLLDRTTISSILTFISSVLQPSGAEQTSCRHEDTASAQRLFESLVSTVETLVRQQKESMTALFPTLVRAIELAVSALRRGQGHAEASEQSTFSKRYEREASATFPAWLWHAGPSALGHDEAKLVSRLLASLTTRAPSLRRKRDERDRTTMKTQSLAAPLSKHGPFLVVSYLRACAHPTMRISTSFRRDMQGGWTEIMAAMGKWERESIMKGLLSDDDDMERSVLRETFKAYEQEHGR